MGEKVILVDETDQRLGEMDKMQAHVEGALHRAFSVYIFSERPAGLSMLVQRRGATKYHFQELWSNACCSHQRPDEDSIAAGQRRLQEELNFSCPLREAGTFKYRAESGNGLIEHELDHVLVGFVNNGELPTPNPAEVDAIRWVTLDALDKELVNQPESLTPWFGRGYELARSFLRRSATPLSDAAR